MTISNDATILGLSRLLADLRTHIEALTEDHLVLQHKLAEAESQLEATRAHVAELEGADKVDPTKTEGAPKK